MEYGRLRKWVVWGRWGLVGAIVFSLAWIVPSPAFARASVRVRRIVDAIQKNFSGIVSLQTSCVVTHSHIIGGQVMPQLRMTGTFAYKLPGRMKYEFRKLEEFLAPDW